MTISWETREKGTGQVNYGPTLDKIAFEAKEYSEATVHQLTLTGLKPDSKYFYAVANSDAAPCSFKTAPAKTRSFRAVIYGDTRSHPEKHAEVAAAINKYGPEFVINTGDLVWDGRLWELWDDFFKAIGPLADHVPYLSAIGNHERTASNYLLFFGFPGNEQWYSFDYANAHLTVLNTNEDFKPGTPQYLWLDDDLKKAQRTAIWRLVVMHHPAYSAGRYGPNQEVIDHLVPLFKKYGVQAVFTGHDHNYQHHRQQGIHYIITGGGGAPLYDIKGGDSLLYGETSLHYLQLEADSVVLKMRMKRMDGSVADSLQLRREEKNGQKPAP
jgi:predicted MPP superfamily phosphohydrolase